jgi:hypothetical protein
MDVGAMMVFASSGWENCPDGRVWDEEMRLARIAADYVPRHGDRTRNAPFLSKHG